MFVAQRYLRRFGAWRRARDWSEQRSVWRFIIDRCEETSTWLAMITVVCTLGGVSIDPAKANAICMLGTGVATLIAVSTRQKAPCDSPQQPPSGGV